MSELTAVLIVFSSVSFLIYGVTCLFSQKMKDEFKRFGLEGLSILTGALEILGGLGLLVGLKFPLLLVVSSAGLCLLMLLGLIFRFRSGDTFLSSSPALFFMLLNGYILWSSLMQNAII